MLGERLSSSSKARETWVRSREPRGVDAGLEALAIMRLQHQRRDDRDEIGIAAALADAVERALDLAHAGIDGGQRIGHGLVGVVMGMDAEMAAGHGFRHGADDLGHFAGQRAAIGVAQHHPARAGLVGFRGAGQRIGRIGLVAVEEMLAVDQHFLAGGARRLDASGGSTRDSPRWCSPAPRARDSPRTWRRSRWPSTLALSSCCRPASFDTERPARLVMPKAVKVARVVRSFGEERGVGRVAARIAALDVVDAELVEQAR